MFLRRLVLFAVLIGCSIGGPAGAAAPAPYRTVYRPSTPAPQQQPSSRTGYAYGWFGARPKAQPQRHFGYHRRYTQWSWQ